MARPSFQATQEHKHQVIEMASLGIRHEDIAKIIDIAPKTLRKHFRKELDHAAITANTGVLKTLLGMATSGKNTSATIFWAKTRCGLRETPESPKNSEKLEPRPDFVVLREH